MKIALQKLEIENFKGIKRFRFSPVGRNASIYAYNERGKTSIFDAFRWLLTDKDSLGQTPSGKGAFQIKRHDPQGKNIPGLEVSVEAVLDVDGQPVTLKKVFKEIWTKKHGKAEAAFSGHTTDYFVDDVPMGTEKEYKARVEAIANEEALKLLTSPLYFCESLTWQQRREILFSLPGVTVSDSEVIASSPDLSDLSEILGNRSMEDFLAMVAAQKKKINEELKLVPARLDEANRALPDVTGLDEATLQAEVSWVTERITSLNAEKATLQAGGAIAEKTIELREIEARILDAQNTARQQQERASAQIRGEIAELNAVKGGVDFEVSRLKREIESLNADIQSLRDRWKANTGKQTAKRAEEWIGGGPVEQCPSGKGCPYQSRGEIAQEEALQKFNLLRARALEELKEQEGQIKAKGETKRADLKSAESKLAEEQAKLPDLEKQLESLQNAQKGSPSDLTSDPELNILKAKKLALSAEIEGLGHDVAPRLSEIDQALEISGFDLSHAQEGLQKLRAHGEGQARIKQLLEQQKSLGAQYEDLERKTYLTEQFVLRKIALVESTLNSKFRLVRWKLFEMQLNGGVDDQMCTAVKVSDGTQYNSMNNAARVQVGLDIIRALSEHYATWLPVFCDEMESVCRMPEMDCQLVRLVVSADDPDLRVEIAKEEARG